MYAIQMEKIYKSFGHKQIFKNFDLTIRQKEMVAITGKSGSGKTTLLNMIGLIEPIDSGDYALFEQKAPRCNSRRAAQCIRSSISYCFQNFALIDDFNVEQNCMLACQYLRIPKQEKKQKIQEALDQVGLNGYQKIKVCELSGGEQQRISLARALLKPGDLLLADEPTGALDPENREIVLQLLRKINLQGKTIIIVTHDPVVADACDRIISLDKMNTRTDP